MDTGLTIINGEHPLDHSRRGRRGRLTRAADRTGRTLQRGMATAEYAVGILAAVAIALVLLKIVTGQPFFSGLLRIVLDLLGKVGAQIK
ncbi:DUF4244 domain-containing protein [Acidipropionibacterium jensenii]|uniref:DUF4244 domain-containing protein n=1 Tax=Acidipropionibacterium jensenii TaxID=1749 RepID=A0A3S4YQ26_9ACTN|nr:DUF4244 domain-containing protein [Acidipropionibacterium jensenii]AZZ38666.1 DUF4244 domain-containing protein [Acidipropionibacterium jensenii]MDN5978156.1 DUF4244 domain-containing protein [Acidipropionibacterium jensenii]MDN5995623.1 DUF4244 domain-containing protein [Acidipropionibacterium jensenii]MDN6426091.1 DUF4244 domain-containing protein [Acidipropionibacterium jensenii]MDN6442269.1 DUF4244 domain-containing protein [Acidipropionibacterium jensenii]